MVRGIANNFKCSSFYLLYPSARLQFFFFLPPFPRLIMALLLKECSRVAVFAPLYDSARLSFHYVDVPFSVLFILLNSYCSLSAEHSTCMCQVRQVSSPALQVSYYLQGGSNRNEDKCRVRNVSLKSLRLSTRYTVSRSSGILQKISQLVVLSPFISFAQGAGIGPFQN